MSPCRLIAAILLLAMPLGAQSQMTTGVIEGVVRDETGAALPGGTIRLTHLGIGISRVYRTSAEGAFTAALLPVGTYELSARLMGFATVRVPAITVTVGQTRVVQVLMKLSAVETTIEVEDKPSVAKLLQFETSTLVDNSQATSLPLNGPQVPGPCPPGAGCVPGNGTRAAELVRSQRDQQRH